MPIYKSNNFERVIFNGERVSKLILNGINVWEDIGYPTKGLEYTLSADETYYIFSGFGTANTKTLVAIASYINDKPVKEINATISDTVETIFIPNTVTKILASGLRGLASLETIIFEKNSLLVETETYALADNPLLKNVILPERLTTIGDTFCYNCPKLETINIPSTVNYIGSYAFGNCPKLTRVDCYPITPPSLPQPPNKLPFRLLSGLSGFVGKIYVPNESILNYVYYSDWSQIASPAGAVDSYIYPMTYQGWTRLFNGYQNSIGKNNTTDMARRHLQLTKAIKSDSFDGIWFRIIYEYNGKTMQAVGRNGDYRFVIDGFFENWYIGCSVCNNFLVFNSISYWLNDEESKRTVIIRAVDALLDIEQMTESIIPVTLTLNNLPTEALVGGTYQCTATSNFPNVPIYWTLGWDTNYKNVATIDQTGLVTFKNIGRLLKITARIGSKSTTKQFLSVNNGSNYTIYFEENGGGIISDLGNRSMIPLELPTPLRDGYSFTGWYLNQSLTTSPVAYTPLTNDITLYAKWEELSLDYYINKNGLELISKDDNYVKLDNPIQFDDDDPSILKLAFVFQDSESSGTIVELWDDGSGNLGAFLTIDKISILITCNSADPYNVIFNPNDKGIILFRISAVAE